MNASTIKTLVVAGSLAAGAVVGTALSKIVVDKVPAAKPALVWVSGALIGVGATILATPATKSEAASILATPTDAGSDS